MKTGRIVRSGLIPDTYYFLSRWERDGKAVVVKDERSRWDVSKSALALEKGAVRTTLRALITQAEYDAETQSEEPVDHAPIAEWLKAQEVGPAGRWQVSHDTPDSEIDPEASP